MPHFHLQGIAVYPYLDNLFLSVPSFALAQSHLQVTSKVLQHHGFLVNWNKSHLVPSQSLEHLGTRLDTRTYLVFLSEEQKIANLIWQVCQSSLQDTLILTKLLGMFTSCQEIIP